MFNSPKNLLPFVRCHRFDFFDLDAEIPKRSGLYVVAYRNGLGWQYEYVGRATNLCERTKGKHYATFGTSDDELVNDCSILQDHGHRVQLFAYPMPRIDSWINHREARLIERLRPVFNTKKERQAISPLWDFIDGALEFFAGFELIGRIFLLSSTAAFLLFRLLQFLQMLK